MIVRHSVAMTDFVMEDSTMYVHAYTLASTSIRPTFLVSSSFVEVLLCTL